MMYQPTLNGIVPVLIQLESYPAMSLTELASAAHLSVDATALVLARLIQLGVADVENAKFVSTQRGAELIRQLNPVEGDLAVVLARILDLLENEEDEEAARPTPYALLTTLDLLLKTNAVLEIPFPRAAVSADEHGAIYVYWRKPSRKLHLTIPAIVSGVQYIYYREGEIYGIEEFISPDRLAHWLRWFANHE